MGSAGNIVGGEWREGVSRSHIHLTDTTHSIHLDEKYNGVNKLFLFEYKIYVVNNTLSQSSMYLDFNIR